jgi:peptidoglycan/LPS O-acetylase OafA/YrhL
VGAARTLGCALVVLVHANIYLRGDLGAWWPGGQWGAPFFGLAVPTFFLVSGHSTGLGAGAALGFWAYTRRRLRRLLPPLAFWTAILLALGYGGSQDWPALLLDVITGVWHLYYLFVMLQFALVVFWLGRRVGPERLGWVWAGAAALSLLAYGASDVLLWSRGGDGGVMERQLEKWLPTWSVFLATGLVLRQRPELLARLRALTAPLLVFVAALYVAYVWELRVEERWLAYHPRQQLLAIGLLFQWTGSLALLLALDAARRGSRAVAAVTRALQAPRHTFAVYLAHPAVIVVLFALGNAAGLSMTHGACVPLVAAAAWALCWALWKLIGRARLPWLERLMFGGLV